MEGLELLSSSLLGDTFFLEAGGDFFLIGVLAYIFTLGTTFLLSLIRVVFLTLVAFFST